VGTRANEQAQASFDSPIQAAAPVDPQIVAPPSHLDRLAGIGQQLKAQFESAAGTALPSPGHLPLSAGGLRLVSVGERKQQLKTVASQARANSAAFVEQDLVSRFAGTTQSNPSVAWCGSNAVIGFSDTGSFVRSLVQPISPSESISFNAWSRSTDAGATFQSGGTLLADPLPAGVAFRDLLGDPVVGCTSSTNFYYASSAIDLTIDGGYFSGITVSRSTDGGQTWGTATMAVRKNGHYLDKPWMAVSPGRTPGSDVIHVTYTDVDYSYPATGGCPRQSRSAIEYVRSTDGGGTWSEPLVIEEICGFFPGFVQGSQVRVGLQSDVYVAWEAYPFWYRPPREIRIRKSGDGGASFGATVPVSMVTPIGDAFGLQGMVRTFMDLQGLAVDRSDGPNRGTVYVAWHDGRNLKKSDPFASPGCQRNWNTANTYCFGDIMVSRSEDGGATWSPPARINDDAIGLAVDQYQPALSVDKDGTVFAFFYDRRRDARNFRIDTYLASSTDGGRTWTNAPVTQASFPSITGQDLYNFFMSTYSTGDHIGIAADGTQASPGVVLAWGDNSQGDPNIQTARR
jgi:hypothetical protein